MNMEWLRGKVTWMHHDVSRYPVFACHFCGDKWHLPQSIRRDLVKLDETAQRARQHGWVVEDDRRVMCPHHAKMLLSS